ncbi:MAG: hypothetical protein AAFR47_17105, partial [Pseudomonadota bacterium]
GLARSARAGQRTPRARSNRLEQSSSGSRDCPLFGIAHTVQRLRNFGAATLGAVALAASAGGALAQSVRVFSGDHAQFTRLALVFSQRMTLEAEATANGYLLRFDPQAVEFDTRGLFERITRDRIAEVAVSQQDGTLQISSACDCHLVIERIDDRTVAVDLTDGPGPPGSLVAGAPEPPQTPQLPPISLPRDVFFVTPDPIPGRLARDFARHVVTGLPPRLSADLSSEPSIPAEVAGAGEASEPAPPVSGLDDWRRAIEGELRKAAGSGLVELQDPAGRAGNSPLLDAPNIDVRTAYDALDPNRGADGAGPACPPEDQYDFFHRSTPEPGLPDLARLRLALVDERGVVSASGATALMHGYLTFGFGAEAAQLVGMTGLTGERAEAYRSLARIVDARSDGASEVWGGLEACPSAVALWAALGQPVTGIGRQTDVAAVQRSFFALPVNLRLHLGPTLADRMDVLNLPEAATAIRNNVDPLLSPVPASTLPSSSEAGERPPSPVHSVGMSEKLVSDLLDRLETRMRRGEIIPAADLATAEALTWEHRGTRTGDKLLGATVLGRLQAADIDGTLELLDAGALEVEDDPGWSASLRRGMGTALADTRDAALLAVALHPQSERITDLLPPADRLVMATRLVGLGFPAPGLDLLAGLPDTGGDQVRLVEAQAHLTGGDPAQALARLAGRESIEAERIRAEAHAALGNHALAADAYAAAGDPDAAALSAWLSGDLEAIDTHGTEAQKAAAVALARLREAAPPPAIGAPDNPLQVPPAAPPSLADVRTLIDRSETLRASLEGIVGPGPGDI